jgi:hypothetical protein
MEKEDLIIEKSKYAYKSAARLLIVVATIAIIFYLSLFKFMSNPNSTKVVSLNRLIPIIEHKVDQMNISKSIDSIDSQIIDDILGWGFVSADESISQQSCDSSGCFYYLFLPGDDQITVSELLNRFKGSLQIQKQNEDLKNIDLNNIFFSSFLLRANATDSAILASRYQNNSCSDSVNEIARKHFGLINFQRHQKYSTIFTHPKSITNDWLSILTPLNLIWKNNKDSIFNTDSTPFSIKNLKKMRAKFINIDNVEFGSSLKIKGEESYLIIHWLVLFLVFCAWWFW